MSMIRFARREVWNEGAQHGDTGEKPSSHRCLSLFVVHSSDVLNGFDLHQGIPFNYQIARKPSSNRSRSISVTHYG
jgi:hypothetical protein